ncbi:YkyA family protein [Bacillus sp. FJAT-27445]|uniref:YkyA family protein n=1 Tax=Bacillus sp. FJAT-27445 TaxID=1679166 RepID=UPI000743BE2A|nr:YkyA family protein [Bacillus sp. FJAT-27445]
MPISPMKRLLFIFAASILLLAGCLAKETPEAQLYEVMEKAVNAEKQFEAQQDPLMELETKEKEIFDKIMGLGLKEYKQISILSDEALAIAAKRKEHIGLERQSLDDSRVLFKEASGILENIKNPELKKKAETLYKTMNERYTAHELLYKEYMKALEGDQKLYTSLKEKDITLENLEGQVNSLNTHYTRIMETNDKFNELTEKYNKEKLEFYKMAGLGNKDS